MRKGLIIIGVILLVLISSGCISQETSAEKYAGPAEKITLGIAETSMLPSLVHIAKGQGYFLEEGVDVDIIGYPTGKAAFKAALKGEINISTVADTPIVFDSFERKDFVVFATIANSVQHVKALTRKDANIKTVQDLRGKKVAMSEGTVSHFFMDMVFIFNAMDSSDVEIVNLKPKEMVDAIVNGDVDVVFTWEPNIVNAEKILGDNALLLPGDVGYIATFSLASKNSFSENNPDLIKKIVKALIKAEEFSKDNRGESVEIVAAYFGTDNERISNLWDFYDYRVSLDQTLLITLEDEARWVMKNDLTNAKKIPNYLDYFYFDALAEIKPEAVTIIH